MLFSGLAMSTCANFRICPRANDTRVLGDMFRVTCDSCVSCASLHVCAVKINQVTRIYGLKTNSIRIAFPLRLLRDFRLNRRFIFHDSIL